MESVFVLYFAGIFLLPKCHANQLSGPIPMLYKPKYCCNCAEKIERVDWNLLTSRRFCDVCATENKRHDQLPRATVAGGVLSIMFGLGTLFGGISTTDRPVQTLNSSPAQFKSEGPSEPQPPARNGLSSVTPSDTGKVSPEAARTAEENQRRTDKVYYCGALTKKGTPCSRKVKSQGARCFQHEGKPSAADS